MDRPLPYRARMTVGSYQRRPWFCAPCPWLLLPLLVSGLVCSAAQPEKPALMTTNSLVREIAPAVFQIGSVRLDKQQRTVSFPASLNMSEGLIEYLIVTASGKTHESLLRTDVEPYHVHLAMLLLGAKGAPAQPLTNAPTGGPIKGDQLTGGPPPPLRGEPVSLEIRWQAGGAEKFFRAEELVLDLKKESPMSRGVFTFNGSRLWEGRFIAQRDGSIVSLITDEDALFNNPRPGREDDSNWQIITKDLPPRGTPVQVTIRLETKPGKK
jgi:hypothetical protein